LLNVRPCASLLQYFVNGRVLDDYGRSIAGLEVHALEGDARITKSEAIGILLLVGCHADASQAQSYRLAGGAEQNGVDLRKLAVHA